MRKYLILCTVSALLGSLFAFALTQMVLEPPTVAEDGPASADLRFRAPITGESAPSDRERRFETPPPVVSAPAARPGSPLTPEELVNIGVYEDGNRSVVNITTRSVRAESFFMTETPTEGSGSGSVLDKQGHILTNYHVIEGARESRVTLYNGESFAAGLVGQDPDNDIAVLRIDAPPEMLFPTPLGDSSNLKVGQKIYAIGNPFGLERTLTVGIISSLNRQLPSRNRRMMKSIIQIDAALNRGNSGGPLLNSGSQLIGMNTAIASSTGQNSGIGFAIPASTIRRVVPQLIEEGRVVRPDIGITRVLQTDDGLVVVSLSEGGPAERAGLRGFKLVRTQKRRGPFVYEETRLDQSSADLITAVDGKSVRTADDLLTIVEGKQPGDRVTLRVVREGKTLEVPITLGSNE